MFHDLSFDGVTWNELLLYRIEYCLVGQFSLVSVQKNIFGGYV